MPKTLEQKRQFDRERRARQRAAKRVTENQGYDPKDFEFEIKNIILDPSARPELDGNTPLKIAVQKHAQKQWDDIYAGNSIPPTPPAAPIKKPKQASAALVAHLSAEPDISSPAFFELSPIDRGYRNEQHKIWEAKRVQLELGPVRMPTPSPFSSNPLLDELGIGRGIERITLYVSPNGQKFERSPNDIPRLSGLFLSKSSLVRSATEKDKNGNPKMVASKQRVWWRKDGPFTSLLSPGSTVRGIRIENRPSSRHLLRENGEWYCPEIQITPWTTAYRTQSGSLLWPDGSPARLKTPTEDIYGRTVEVKDIGDRPGIGGYIITDQGKWVLSTEWFAKDVWIPKYEQLIADTLKKDNPEHAELYAPSLKLWTESLEALQGTFTVPTSIRVEPPLEDIVLPHPEQAPFNEIPEPKPKPIPKKRPTDLPIGQMEPLERFAARDNRPWEDEL